MKLLIKTECLFDNRVEELSSQKEDYPSSEDRGVGKIKAKKRINVG